MGCPWCGDEVLDGEAYGAEAYGPEATRYHRECWVRQLVGPVATLLGLPIGRAAGEWPAPGDPPGYTRAEAAAAAAKLAVEITRTPAGRREGAIAEAREIVRAMGPDAIFVWRPGFAEN